MNIIWLWQVFIFTVNRISILGYQFGCGNHYNIWTKACKNALIHEIIISRVDVLRSVFCLRFRFHSLNFHSFLFIESSFVTPSLNKLTTVLCRRVKKRGNFKTNKKYLGNYDYHPFLTAKSKFALSLITGVFVT